MILQTLKWLPSVGNESAISSIKSYASAGELTLNSAPYTYDQCVRSVAFSSTSDLSASIITIRGIGSDFNKGANAATQNINLSYVEVLNGPNNNTVETSGIFKRIDSISINTPAANLGAGFGSFGLTDYLFHDTNITNWNLTFQTVKYNPIPFGGLFYTIYRSVIKPEIANNLGNLTEYPFSVPGYVAGFTDTTQNQFLRSRQTIATSWCSIQQTTQELFYFNALQQGTRS
jgi:hypothetical protein